MRKCITIQGLLFVLLIVISLHIALQPDYLGNSEGVSFSPQYSIKAVLTDTSTSNITWTSRTQQVPQIVRDNCVIDGDHVVLNATFFPFLNVIECNLTIWNPQTGVNDTISSSGSTIIYNTYYLDRMNQTYNIIVNGTTVANDFVILQRENLTICNFFTPDVTLYNPVSLGSNRWNITWSSTDENADDVCYYSVWLSRDCGVTFVLLQQNLTFTNYIWDSTQWLLADYIVKVRAYSVDLTTNKCGVDNPPLSYWPGDFCNALSYLHAGGVHSQPIPSFHIDIDELTYEFGSIENTITVYVSLYNQYILLTELDYFVYVNGTLWFQGLFHRSVDSFTINIDGFSVGVHHLSISIGILGPYDREYFTITVTASTTPNTTPSISPQDWSPIIQTLAIGISIGSITIIALVLVLSLQLKRKQVIEYV